MRGSVQSASRQRLGNAGPSASCVRLTQLYRAGVLNVGPCLMVGVMEHYFVQASPIKDFAALVTLGEVFLFFGWQLFVLVGFHLSRPYSQSPIGVVKLNYEFNVAG
jgi:hypothetical protein